ncbi:efflux RND transporter periplasmic adaptor subunit [Ramlibacter ginsenosidimutans]|uniref:Efflux RND transporter periplasmic adaptor subunit n=1 Tax=Ramlibacter ginsenosidimutans TaxID=502333 RepID=A0A934TVW2_9BURK|nr:efflux RND transporter periplasmic adaptor subunit [Ramlibacter ginsenosidimutans]MBK6008439.1 efflux RND transporter periplasmic adaptor subunit [Ramlibacter ginsenosidimutans]
MAIFAPTRFAPSAALLLALALAGCSRTDAPPEPIRAVKVMTISASTMESRYEFSGEVRPRVESRLGFRVGGKITQREVEVGQHVAAGTVLAQLDPQDFRLAADAARAQVAAARTNRDLAAADYQRYRQLREQNFISGADLERRESTLKAAQAQLEQAQAQLASQGNQAGYTRLVADVSGVVTAVEAEVGQVVAAGTPVVRIAADGPRDVVFSVPEDKVVNVRTGTEVTVRQWASDETLAGRIREVAASADPVTRTYPVKVSLETAGPPLGATVTVLPLVLEHAGMPVIKIPTSALRQEGQGSAVWVLDRASMTVRSQPVQIATADGNDAVIAAGLQPGMVIVSAGVHVLSQGQKVTLWHEKTSELPAVAAQDPGQPVAGAAQAATLPATR